MHPRHALRAMHSLTLPAGPAASCRTLSSSQAGCSSRAPRLSQSLSQRRDALLLARRGLAATLGASERTATGLFPGIASPQIRRFASASDDPQSTADFPHPLPPPPRREVDPSKGFAQGGYSASDFPPSAIRNFSIVAHVDHGKSTLADRLLEATGAVPRGLGRAQYLDRLEVERERGITVKAQTASLVYRDPALDRDFLLNLVDTPGHVDFSYEVSRSLAACQGAVLLTDATQGVQAQTVANYFLAKDQGLRLVHALNKMDAPGAEPERVLGQLFDAFGVEDAPGERVLTLSGKTGAGVQDQLLPALVRRIPPPQGDPAAPFRALLFDAYYDAFRGVVCLLAIVDGEVRRGQKVVAAAANAQYEISEVGLLAPEPTPTPALRAGQVGYVLAGMKETRDAQVGDTWHAASAADVALLPGFRPARAVVYAGVYPTSQDGYDRLSQALAKLTLNDASVSVAKEHSHALGAGWRCGFLGLLHMDVFRQRLEQEHGAVVLITPPTVPCRVEMSHAKTEEIQSPAEFPLNVKVTGVWERTVLATIVCPSEHLGAVMQLCQSRRGDLQDHSSLGTLRSILKYTLPLSELGTDFYDELKSATSGYASFDYEPSEERRASLQRLDLHVNGQPVDALARVVHSGQVQRLGRQLCAQMAALLDRQSFEIAVQAVAGGKIVARETLKALRKNVLAKCYGGDISRKRKLLEKQKEGKKRMRSLGNVQVSHDIFQKLMTTNR